MGRSDRIVNDSRSAGIVAQSAHLPAQKNQHQVMVMGMGMGRVACFRGDADDFRDELAAILERLRLTGHVTLNA